ncbi:MAG: dihydrolipoyllysine-residue acetyltransferase [Pseudomonadota bacterium]
MPAIDIKVPDIGDFADVPVIEILVNAGDVVSPEDPLLTLESDKATMEVPAPQAGKIVEVLVNVGDKVSQGSAILKLEADGDSATDGDASSKANGAAAPPTSEPSAAAAPAPMPATVAANATAPSARPSMPPPVPDSFGNVHASPSVRMIARELGVDLKKLTGTGAKGRITKDDVKAALAGASGPAAGAAASHGGMGIPPIPAQDFSKFGPTEEKQLSRLKKLSGPHLHRAWLNVPHVTHTDEADITELDKYRRELDAKAKPQGYRVTLLSFLIKAAVATLKEHPEFNSSIAPGGASLIYKRYYNIGVAVDTPDGLVVPTVKEADRKGIIDLSKELGDVSARMREGKITPSDLQGGTFSISSLGGIGGTQFTPIVNAPEVAILGVVRSQMKPKWDGAAFQPANMLPLCLSYDHRVIDGALAARFTRRLCEFLEDVRQLVL